MGNPFGVIFGLSIDAADADAAIAHIATEATSKLPGAFQQAGRGVAEGLAPAEKGLLSSREAVRLLSEEMGIHLPRAVSGAISKMLPDVAMLGGGLLGAFAIAEIPKFLSALHGFSDEVMGFTKDVKSFYDDTLAAQRKLLTEFSSAQGGMLLVQQTRQHIDELRREKIALEATADTTRDNISTLGIYAAAKLRLHQIDKEDAAAQKLLLEQLDQLAKVEKKEHAPAVEHATRALKDHYAALAVHIPKIPPLILSVEQLALSWRHDEEAENRALSATLRLIQGHSQLQAGLQENVGMQFLFNHALDEIPQLEAAATVQATRWAQALRLVRDAQNDAVVSEAARLAGTLGARRVAAGMEAAWETAKGIASLAVWDFRGAALHFMAATEYGIIAGTSGNRGGYGEGGGYGGRESRYLNAAGEPLTRGQSSGAGSGGGGTTVIVNIAGHLLNMSESIDYLTGAISDAVDNRDVHLSASRVKDSTLSRDSFNS